MKSTSQEISRRRMIQSTAAAAFTIVPRHVLGRGRTAPSDKLNVAAVGVGGMGRVDVTNIGKTENIVALCDVDAAYAAKVFAAFPQAAVHSDFRKMLETQKNIDAVIVATPDHLHAVVTMTAMRMGKHVYCEKPLTHSVYEARKIGEAARKYKVATQMGNQGQASEEARLVMETIWDGAIGAVREVHAWSNRKPDICPRGIPRPKDTPPVPETLSWDLWVGPSPMRPYHPSYLPFTWRAWWDFGSGVLGDIGCHQLSTIFKTLKLGHPKTVEACSTNWQLPDEISRETAPLASITRYTFAAEGDRPELVITWYDGGMQPLRPVDLEADRKFAVDDGILYVGDKGKILNHRLLPDTRAREYGKPPQKLDRSPGHYQEWIDACKGGKPAGANFADHAAHLAEVVLLGNVAIRTNQKIEWDPVGMRTNSEEANQLLNPPYREGWQLD
jgi:predicted dehydrogenase